ncbi:MAG: rRNA maturation RNase YbeY [Acidimicrobiaceae bacterium]|nr:rRNA maturation RNase YbeY [Acidimicrobiaceae bacterium]
MPGGPERPLGPEPPSGSDPGDGLGAGPLIPAGSQPVPLPSLSSNAAEGLSVLADGVEVFAADEQSSFPVDSMRWVQLAQAVLADEGVRGEAELSLLFVDEVAIADLNRRFLAKDGPTDVLAFPIDEEPVESGRNPDSGGSGPGFASDLDEAPTLLGDVVICPAVAARNAPEHAGTYDDELALLVVHGVLHLLGMDHLEDDEAEAMEARERELLARYHAPLAVSRAHTSDGEATVRTASEASGSTTPPPQASPPASSEDPDDGGAGGGHR